MTTARRLHRAITATIPLGIGMALLLACGEPSHDAVPSSSAPRTESKPTQSKPTQSKPTETVDPRDDGPPLRKDGTVFAEAELMGTRVSINVWAGPPDQADPVAAGNAIREAFGEMARLEQIMSEWQPDSELSRLSDAAGNDPRKLSPELMRVLLHSRRIAEDTNGAFDPTFHGVGQLWHFQPGAQPPSPEAIAAKLPLVGWQQLELDEKSGTGRLAKPGMRLGLGAIGKGFAADEASALLTTMGFPNHVVEVGGDTYAAGAKEGKPWMVGIQRPDAPGVVGILPSRDRAVVTSGDYQRYLEFEGKRYAHILDPRTGWPVPADRSPKSVTLVASTATDADAYCTAVAVMGVEDGLAYVEAHEGLEVVIVTQDDELRVSSGLRDELVLPPRDPQPPAAPVPDPASTQ
ncbi:FAD:protein FMN transferase [Paraliomyxa miuraensis]|uniref:FAD:protein FMN transferase n=1 Tax=Paraliomyxa miuraensis TaxID=376150 RepID=UPI0022512845|nr:FAD:protein FMN transferase [Paraliomyxa miuraensis]MCX4246578.1 FAD:protein FMN transferase [Paraliomyxa miuraensis]